MCIFNSGCASKVLAGAGAGHAWPGVARAGASARRPAVATHGAVLDENKEEEEEKKTCYWLA
jgi:hypothetical protein